MKYRAREALFLLLLPAVIYSMIPSVHSSDEWSNSVFNNLDSESKITMMFMLQVYKKMAVGIIRNIDNNSTLPKAVTTVHQHTCNIKKITFDNLSLKCAHDAYESLFQTPWMDSMETFLLAVEKNEAKAMRYHTVNLLGDALERLIATGECYQSAYDKLTSLEKGVLDLSKAALKLESKL